MVSVIITTYGGSVKLRRAVHSVLNQTYTDYEVIVVDDNDPDSESRKKTESIMNEFDKNFKVKYLKHPCNKNGSAARNTGINAATGDYIAFLDDDDVYLKKRLEKSIEYMEKNPDLGGVCTGIVLLEKGYISDVFERKEKTKVLASDLLIRQSVIGSGSNILLKSEIVRAVSGFDESFKRHQDIEFMYRIAKIAKIEFIEDLLIIKDNGESRKPSYRVMKDAYFHFSNVFKKDISELNENDMAEYHDDHVRVLLYVAKMTGNSSDVKDALSLAKEENVYLSGSFIIKSKIQFFIRKLMGINFYNKLKSIKNKNKDLKFKEYINKNVMDEVNMYMEF